MTCNSFKGPTNIDAVGYKFWLCMIVIVHYKELRLHENFFMFSSIVDLWRNKSSKYGLKVNFARPFFGGGRGGEVGRLGYIVWERNTYLHFFVTRDHT